MFAISDNTFNVHSVAREGKLAVSGQLLLLHAAALPQPCPSFTSLFLPLCGFLLPFYDFFVVPQTFLHQFSSTFRASFFLTSNTFFMRFSITALRADTISSGSTALFPHSVHSSSSSASSALPGSAGLHIRHGNHLACSYFVLSLEPPSMASDPGLTRFAESSSPRNVKRQSHAALQW